MDELIAFLRARLDEDEQAATNNSRLRGERWTAVEISPGRLTWQVIGAGRVVVEALGWEVRHIARHDPARVLADVAAKRAIVDAFELSERAKLLPGDNVFGYHATGLLIAIRHLAAAYADHPDYREKWRPSA